jgi:hypothetical protein
MGDSLITVLVVLRPSFNSATGVPDIDPEVSSSKRQAQRGSGFSAKSSAFKGYLVEF